MGCSNADTPRFDIRNSDGPAVGFVDATMEFEYLSSIIYSSLASDAGVDRRIKAATSAFGALKNILKNLPVDIRVKSSEGLKPWPRWGSQKKSMTRSNANGCPDLRPRASSQGMEENRGFVLTKKSSCFRESQRGGAKS